MAMKSEVKQLSSLLQQLQSFLKSLSARPPPSSGGGAGVGPGGGGGGGVGGSNSTMVAQQSLSGKFVGGGGGGGGGGAMGTSSGQGVIQGQSNRQSQTQHVHHLTTDAFPRFVLFFLELFTRAWVLTYSFELFLRTVRHNNHHQSFRLFLNLLIAWNKPDFFSRQFPCLPFCLSVIRARREMTFFTSLRETSEGCGRCCGRIRKHNKNLH